MANTRRPTSRDTSPLAGGSIGGLLERLRTAADPEDKFQVASEIALVIHAERERLSRARGPLEPDGYESMLDLALEALLAAVTFVPDPVVPTRRTLAPPLAPEVTGAVPNLAVELERAERESMPAFVSPKELASIDDETAPDGFEEVLKQLAVLRAHAGLCAACGAGAGRCAELDGTTADGALTIRFLCGRCRGPLVAAAPRIIRRKRRARGASPSEP